MYIIIRGTNSSINNAKGALLSEWSYKQEDYAMLQAFLTWLAFVAIICKSSGKCEHFSFLNTCIMMVLLSAHEIIV